MAVKERVKDFLKNQNIPISLFESKIGASNGYVNSISKSIGIDKLEAVLEQYPNLNLEWLLIGKGEMLRDTSQIAQPSHIATDTNCQEKLSKQEAHYTSIIQSKDAIIISKNETISILKEQITTKDGQLAAKDVQIDNLLSDSKKNNLIHTITDKLNLSNNK